MFNLRCIGKDLIISMTLLRVKRREGVFAFSLKGTSLQHHKSIVHQTHKTYILHECIYKVLIEIFASPVSELFWLYH